MKQKKGAGPILRRLEALALAALTLWIVTVTAGSETSAEALSSLKKSLPRQILRWELGDFWRNDDLSPPVVMALSEAPMLRAARPEVAELRVQVPLSEHYEVLERPQTRPAEETPVEIEATEDNGVPAKTLIPTDPSGYTVYGKTYISNSTEHSLSPERLSEPFSAGLTDETGPQILIIHTHGSEAYTPAGNPDVVWSGDHRTTDYRYNVVNVGDEMAEVFGAAGISVLHDRTLYDYPSYSDAYERSLAAVERHLAEYPSIQFVLDVHRDAVADTAGNQYKVISAVEDGKTAAQMTLVVGSDGSGLPHPDWMENLRLAVRLQEDLLSRFPTLMRPVLLRNSRYNQHAATGSLLLEVGAAGNSPEEAVMAGRLFAEQMAAVLQEKSAE